MKRSQSVTLVLIGAASLAACQDDRTAPPPDRRFAESLALPVTKPRCDRPEDFSLPECHDPQNPPAPAQTRAASSGGHGAAFFFFHGGGSPAYGPATPSARTYTATGTAVRAAAPAGATSFGGFGSTGRATMAMSAAS